MAVKATEGRKRKPYKKISDSLRAQIENDVRVHITEILYTHMSIIITSAIVRFANFSSVNISVSREF